MLERHSRRAALGLASLLASACTSGVALEDIPEESGSLICETIETCGGLTLAAFIGPDCEGQFSESFEQGSVPRWEELIARGTVTYDPAKAAECLDAQRALGCDLTFSVQPAACTEIFIGTIDTGGACGTDEECAGDAYCDGAACPETTGACAPRKANGAACSGSNECQAGLGCQMGTCRVASSNRDGACEGTTGLGCPFDQLCSGSSGTEPGVCTDIDALTTAALGEDCNPQGLERLCQVGLSCAAVGIEGLGADFDCVEPVGAGEACFIGFPSMCPEGLYCTAMPGPTGGFEGTCDPLPTEGMPCAETMGSAPQCAAGLECRSIADETVCFDPRLNGEPCETDSECVTRSCNDGVCGARPLCPA